MSNLQILTLDITDFYGLKLNLSAQFPFLAIFYRLKLNLSARFPFLAIFYQLKIILHLAFDTVKNGEMVPQ